MRRPVFKKKLLHEPELRNSSIRPKDEPMRVEDHLASRREEMPTWLINHRPGKRFNVESFFSSRTVMYPGAGLDFQPLQMFGRTHFAHCFIHVDYGIERTVVTQAIASRATGLTGYFGVDRLFLRSSELAPVGWVPHILRMELGEDPYRYSTIKPYAFIQILQRAPEYGDSHGPLRIACLHIGGCAVSSYDAIYCQGRRKPPVALVIQDHGYGGNWTRFDQGGFLRELASRTKQFPDYLLVAVNQSTPWLGYQDVFANNQFFGGAHRSERRLFQRKELIS